MPASFCFNHGQCWNLCVSLALNYVMYVSHSYRHCFVLLSTFIFCFSAPPPEPKAPSGSSIWHICSHSCTRARWNVLHNFLPIHIFCSFAFFAHSLSEPEAGVIECPVCGVGKTGKKSCCIRGGSWFKDCGTGDDPQFGHTWGEGAEACKGKCAFDVKFFLFVTLFSAILGMGGM